MTLSLCRFFSLFLFALVANRNFVLSGSGPCFGSLRCEIQLWWRHSLCFQLCACMCRGVSVCVCELAFFFFGGYIGPNRAVLFYQLSQVRNRSCNRDAMRCDAPRRAALLVCNLVGSADEQMGAASRRQTRIGTLSQGGVNDRSLIFLFLFFFLLLLLF